MIQIQKQSPNYHGQQHHPGQGITVVDKKDKNFDRDGFIRDYRTDGGYNVSFEPGEKDEQYKENQIIPNWKYTKPDSMPPKVK